MALTVKLVTVILALLIDVVAFVKTPPFETKRLFTLIHGVSDPIVTGMLKLPSTVIDWTAVAEVPIWPLLLIDNIPPKLILIEFGRTDKSTVIAWPVSILTLDPSVGAMPPTQVDPSLHKPVCIEVKVVGITLLVTVIEVLFNIRQVVPARLPPYGTIKKLIDSLELTGIEEPGVKVKAVPVVVGVNVPREVFLPHQYYIADHR